MLIPLALQLFSASPAGAAPELPPEAKTILEAWLPHQVAPGVSVAAVDRMGLLWAGGVGLARLDPKRPATAATRYQFASVTKVYTALLLAQLVSEGVVGLDDPVTTYLPEFSPRYPDSAARPATLADLATHSAGFVRDMTGPKQSGRSHCYTWDEALRWQQTDGFAALPGAQYKYSNFGYAVLGAALAQAAGKDYRTLVRQRILTPLDLRSTGFSELRTAADLAVAYHDKAGRLVPEVNPVWDFRAQAPASELISTVTDMGRFVAAHLAGAAASGISPQVRQLLFTPRFPAGETTAVGLGWHYQWSDGLPRWQHAGSVNQFNSLVMVRPEAGIGLVLAANGPVRWDTIALRLLKIISRRARTPNLDKHVGDYQDGHGGTVMIRRTPEAVLTIEVKGAIRMIPWGADTFRIIEGLNKDEWVRFVTEGNKQALLWEGRRCVQKPEPHP